MIISLSGHINISWNFWNNSFDIYLYIIDKINLRFQTMISNVFDWFYFLDAAS